jgi:two-component system, NarL family, nitrate/nitrite response regulator NarL
MSVEAKDNENKTGFATTIVISDVMLFREGISAGLRRIGQLDVIGAFCPDEGLRYLANSSPQIAILDTSRRRALAHADAIRQICPATCIVAFGIGAHEDAIAGAESGIAAFVGEEGSVEDINRAALSAINGQSFCSPELTAQLLFHIAHLANSRPMRTANILTVREEEIASLVEHGLSNKQIAIELQISPATVKNHVHSILDKLSLPGRSAVGLRHASSQGRPLAVQAREVSVRF